MAESVVPPDLSDENGRNGGTPLPSLLLTLPGPNTTGRDQPDPIDDPLPPVVPDPFDFFDDAFGTGFMAPPPGPFDPTLSLSQQARFTQFADSVDFSSSPQPIDIDSFADNDRIIGSVFGDNIELGAGDDAVMGGPGDDEMDGNTGFDTAVYRGSILQYDVMLSSFDEFTVIDMSHNMSGMYPVYNNGLSDLRNTEFSIAPPLETPEDDDVPELDEGTDELEDFEAIRFADYTLLLDGSNNAPFVTLVQPAGGALRVSEDQSLELTFQIYDFDGDQINVDGISSELGALFATPLSIGGPPPSRHSSAQQ